MQLPQSVVWTPSSPAADGWVRPGARMAVLRGLAGRCPCCGKGSLFSGWLRPRANCAACGAPLGLVRADDAPPYFVIFIVGHLLIASMVMLEAVVTLSATAEAAIFLPIAAILCLALLRPVKGATIGLMIQLGLAAPAHAQSAEG